MTRYSDAGLLKGDFAHMAAELRAGDRKAPKQKDWDKTACDNRAEEAAQEVAKHIFAVQQSLDPEKEQLEILTYSAIGQMKVLAVVPGEGDLLRVDGVLMPEERPASVVIHASLLSLTIIATPVEKPEDVSDEGLQIGFVIFDELKDRQKARYKKKPKSKSKSKPKMKPFGLPKAPSRVKKKTAVKAKSAATKKPAVKKSVSKKAK